VARAVGLVEERGRAHGVEFPVQMTVATTDGETTWAFRYSTEGRSRTLYHSTDIATLRHQYPENTTLHQLSDDARLVVSEPLGDLRGAWREVPESSCVMIRGGAEEVVPFVPTH
jgi:glutamine amidotransferase